MTWTPKQILHDRSTRGEQLTPDEQAQLDAWYAELEREQSQILFGEDTPPVVDITDQERLVLLQQQVDELLGQLNRTTQRLQEISAQNQALRNEISVLRAKVAERGLLEVA